MCTAVQSATQTSAGSILDRGRALYLGHFDIFLLTLLTFEHRHRPRPAIAAQTSAVCEPLIYKPIKQGNRKQNNSIQY